MDGSLGLALVSPPELVFGHAVPLIPLSVTLFPLLPCFSHRPRSQSTPAAARSAVVKRVTFPSLPSLEWTEECPSLPPPAAANHVSNNQEAVREAPVQGNNLVKPIVKVQQGFFSWE